MKHNIFLVLSLILFIQCKDKISIKGEIVKIEPFPFATQLSGDFMLNYKQAAWLKPVDRYDSLAILFDYRISHGQDISKILSTSKIYQFKLQKINMNEANNEYSKSENDNVFIDSLQDYNIIEEKDRIKSNQYWLVKEIKQ